MTPADIGCEGCSLGCAVTCGDEASVRAERARLTLVASGIGLVLLVAGPGLVARSPTVAALAAVCVGIGLLVAGVAAVAWRRGRPAGDAAARVAHRALPVGVVTMLATWIGALVAFVT